MKPFATRYVRLGLSVAVALAAQTVLLPSIAQAEDAPTTAPAGPTQLDLMLADRFAQLADTMLMSGTDMTHMTQAKVLSAISQELNPAEVRFARTSAAIYLRTGDADAALETLKLLRKLTPKDELVAVHYFDLELARMETAEQKLAYIDKVVSIEAVPAAVRSHVAVQAYDLRLDRAEDQKASEMLDLALKLNPQNIGALRLKLRRASVDGAPRGARLTAMCNLLMAAPSDPQTLVGLAQIFTHSGMYQEAALAYNIAIVSAQQAGVQAPIEDRIDHVAAIILAGAPDAAANYLEGAYRQAMLLDPELLTLRAVSIQQLTGVPEDLQLSSVDQARSAQIGRIAYISRMIRNPELNEPLPTTLPTDSLPNVLEDALALANDGHPDMVAAYAGAVKALLEFETIVGNVGKPTPDIDALVGALKTLVGETDPLFARFEGMRLLQAGNVDEARPKLEAAGETDRFARAELMKITQATTKPTGLQELFDQEPDGMDAVLFQHLYRNDGVAPHELPVAAEIHPLTDPVIEFVNKCFSEPKKIYTVRARPVTVSHDFGMPILAEITIVNKGSQPIMIGNGGLIGSTMTFDASVRGVQQKLPRVAMVKLTGRIKLGPRDSLTQIVRIDGGMLASLLRQVPTVSLGITAIGYTNPFVTKTETVPGVGGFGTQVGSIIERKSLQLENPKMRESIMQMLSAGTPEQHLVLYELFSSILPQLAKSDQQAAQQAYQEFSKQVFEAMDKESQPGLRGFAIALRAVISGDASKVTEAISTILDQPNELDQALAIVLANDLDKETRTLFATRIKGEAATPRIAEMAQALADMPEPPATQPTTQPAQ